VQSASISASAPASPSRRTSTFASTSSFRRSCRGQTLFGGAVVDRRETTTQLIVKDGQTVVISGIIRNELTDIVRKVPLLGDIPLIGELFKSREKTNKATELFVFITPIVINNTDDADAMNEPYRLWLEQQKKNLNVPDGPYPGLQPDVPAAKRDPTDPRPDEKPPEKPESDAQIQQSSAAQSGESSQAGSSPSGSSPSGSQSIQ
jgi:Flp pilus assembly secretin CpaC